MITFPKSRRPVPIVGPQRRNRRELLPILMCPQGCMSQFHEHWQVDAHLSAVHPGWMYSIAKQILPVG
jgi:predicted dienelactone hydrolase